MLFAGWKVRIVKNSDRGLENPDRAKNKSDCRIRYRDRLEKINADIYPVLAAAGGYSVTCRVYTNHAREKIGYGL